MAALITIVDCGMGNLRSVANAFAAIGADAALINDPGELRDARAIVLPGVGAFGQGMSRLRASGFDVALREQVIGQRKPFLGLCLGLQLLATRGLEHGEHEGLGWIEGVAQKIPTAANLRLPHIGWNDVRSRPTVALFKGIAPCESFYFVHSYALIPADSRIVSGVTSYGSEFVASIEQDNIHATQFHPEKSHTAGLRLLANFAGLANA